MSGRSRFFAFLVSLIAVQGLVVAVHSSAPATASGLLAYALNQPGEAPDYATSTFSDPWDFSNPADIIMDKGPTSGVSNAVMRGGALRYTVSGASYISPLWTGYLGSVRLGRDGAVPANQIVASSYTRMRIHAYASSATSAAIFWFTQDGFKGLGGRSFALSPGWHEYDLSLTNNFPNGVAWSGRIVGLRMSTNAHVSTNISVDFMRLYTPQQVSILNWHSTGTSAVLYWSAIGQPSTTESQYGGQVFGSRAILGVGDSSVDVSGYPAGTTFYALADGVTWVPITTLQSRPNVIVDTPAAGGCGDFATAMFGHPWRFTATGGIGLKNVKWVTWTGGILSATNSGPIQNDPEVILPVGRGIVGTKWRYLTLDTGYDGPFNLANVAGGGTMGRIIWRANGKTYLSQSNDIITYSGRRKMVIDMGMPASKLVEPEVAGAYAFAQSQRINYFRWDPNEDRGNRRWHVYSMRLGADCATSTSFNVTWHDNGFVPGAVSTVYAVGGTAVRLGTVAEVAGTNTFTVSAARLPAGRYRIKVMTQNPAGISGAYSATPLVIVH